MNTNTAGFPPCSPALPITSRLLVRPHPDRWQRAWAIAFQHPFLPLRDVAYLTTVTERDLHDFGYADRNDLPKPPMPLAFVHEALCRRPLRRSVLSALLAMISHTTAKRSMPPRGSYRPCHKSPTLCVQKSALESKTTHYIARRSALFLNEILVERRRIELPTFALRTRRSPS